MPAKLRIYSHSGEAVFVTFGQGGGKEE